MKGTLTCPECGHRQQSEIPSASCQAFYKCAGCGRRIKAEKSCCVFCDYGNRPCHAKSSSRRWTRK